MNLFEIYSKYKEIFEDVGNQIENVSNSNLKDNAVKETNIDKIFFYKDIEQKFEISFKKHKCRQKGTFKQLFWFTKDLAFKLHRNSDEELLLEIYEKVLESICNYLQDETCVDEELDEYYPIDIRNNAIGDDGCWTIPDLLFPSYQNELISNFKQIAETDEWFDMEYYINMSDRAEPADHDTMYDPIKHEWHTY